MRDVVWRVLRPFWQTFPARIERQMPVSRTLPSPAGAGSYGALSRPLKKLSECMRHRRLCALERLAKNAPVAQLDRALDYESRGQEFESLRARHSTPEHDLPRMGVRFCDALHDWAAGRMPVGRRPPWTIEL